MFRFIKNVFKAAIRTVKNFFVSLVSNIEAVTILTLASVGTATLISELPFMITLPMWIEATMIAPVLATSIIILLTIIMTKRMAYEQA